MSSSPLTTYRPSSTGAANYSDEIAASERADERRPGERCEGPTWRERAASPVGRSSRRLRARHKDSQTSYRQDPLKTTAKLNLVRHGATAISTQASDQHRQPSSGKNLKISQAAAPRRQQHLRLLHAVLQLVCLQQLLARNIKESLAGPSPSTFLDSGRAIACNIGQHIEIGDYIPFSDPNLVRCYICRCPEGSVVCGRSDDPSCNVKTPPSSLGGKPAKFSQSPHAINRLPAGGVGNRVSPTTLAHHHHHHDHHHHHNSKSPIGRAKTNGVPRKSGKLVSAGSDLPNAVALVQQKQHAQGRLVLHSRQQSAEMDVEEENEPEVEPAAPSPTKTTMFRTASHEVPAILSKTRVPLDDPTHIQTFAETSGLSVETFIKKRDKYLSDRTSTTPQRPVEKTPVASTTSTTSTTTSPLPTQDDLADNSELDENPESGENDFGGLAGGESESATATASDISETRENTAMETPTTTTQQPPFTSSISLPDDWSATTEAPPQSPDWPPNHFDRDDWNGLIERDPAVVTGEGQDTLIKPGHEQTIGRHNPDGIRNKIDYNSANDVMEQVSHDGMLYIAIGVEAFILVVIFAMMIIFYVLRNKTPDELLDHHQALQMPSRSPSLDKA